MSNWSRAKVTFKKMDSALLSDALKAMGYYPNFNDKKVDGSYSYDGSRECDCVLYDINTDQTSNIGLSFTTDKDGNIIVEHEGYVPSIMCPEDEGYGDYIIMNIDENGFIQGWEKELIPRR